MVKRHDVDIFIVVNVELVPVDLDFVRLVDVITPILQFGRNVPDPPHSLERN